MGKKSKTITLSVLIITMLVTVPVLAWFYYNRSMQSVAMIKLPDDLTIGEGEMNSSLEIDLSQIDVSNGTSKDIVFCVYSKFGHAYNLQLAHTTNIGFKYTIYMAEQSEGGTYSDNAGKKYQQKTEGTSAELPGRYLNKDENKGTATSAYHNKTYTNGTTVYQSEKVQKNAEPLYWKTTKSINFPETKENGYYINYYILNISWDGLNLTNNKETDMVYLMAETGS